MVSLELPANMSVSKEKNIQPVMNLVDDSKGREILLSHSFLLKPVNFTAVHNSKCVHHLSLEIQCKFMSIYGPLVHLSYLKHSGFAAANQIVAF